MAARRLVDRRSHRARPRLCPRQGGSRGLAGRGVLRRRDAVSSPTMRNGTAAPLDAGTAPAGEASGGWPLVWALSLAQLIAWGSIYYGFSLFVVPMEAELGWGPLSPKVTPFSSLPVS